MHSRPFGGDVGRAARARQYLLLASLFVMPARLRVRALYEMDRTDHLFTERSLYHNMGYWKDQPATLDEACHALARLLGEAAGLEPCDHVLDVGFGFADQDLDWFQQFAPRRIVGLDLVPLHVAVGQRRVAERGLADRIELRRGSATALPFDNTSFDKVLALESAFHFVTRERFFTEAHRVLRPGGRIALVEPIPLANHEQSWLAGYLQRSVVATPKENMYPRCTYAGKLMNAGFRGVRVTSIREHVHEPFMRYLVRRIRDPEIVQRINPLVRGLWRGWLDAFASGGSSGGEGQDYVIAVADKP